MYLDDPSDQLFAYKCENNNRCLSKVMNGKTTDVNFNNQNYKPKKSWYRKSFNFFLV